MTCLPVTKDFVWYDFTVNYDKMNNGTIRKVEYKINV